MGRAHLALGDGWIATMCHIARENPMFGIGVNPVLHIDQIPAGFPHRDRLIPEQYREENSHWIEEGTTVIVAPSGEILAGPARQREETLVADLDLGEVLAARGHLDPVGHYHRPDIFRRQVDTSPARRSPKPAIPAASRPWAKTRRKPAWRRPRRKRPTQGRTRARLSICQDTRDRIRTLT